MAPQSHIFLFIIISLSFLSFYASLEDGLQPNNYQEFGYDLEAYPSYFSTLEDGKFPNSPKLESGSFNSNNYIQTLVESSAKTVSVDSFGAKGDGKADDTEAFEKAWDEACSSTGAVFVVPKKSYLVKQIRFKGPCEDALTVQIYGTIEASDDRSDYKKDGRHWLTFDSVQNLLVEGGGIIDGNGKIWWKNSCKTNKARVSIANQTRLIRDFYSSRILVSEINVRKGFSVLYGATNGVPQYNIAKRIKNKLGTRCKGAPTALTFYKEENLTVKNLNIQNAQQIQISFDTCVNVQASNLTVTAPEDSPNTDGIHITRTQNMQLSSSVIGTGDDCISIENGTQKLEITNITCGPGHGISIGSLGDRKSEAHVSNVTVNGANLSQTTYGLRIKTYQGGSGDVSNIKFQNIDMQKVENPIIIDQNYFDEAKLASKKQKSATAVQVKKVVYQNITGTSASKVAINFDCSKIYPCEGIILQDVTLTGQGDEAVKAECNNVNFEERGDVSPRCMSS